MYDIKILAKCTWVYLRKCSPCRVCWVDLAIEIGQTLTHWGRDIMDAIFQTTFSNGFSWMKIYEFRLRFHWSLFLGVQFNNIPALVQIMAWRRPGDKPLFEPMLVFVPTHICVTRPQWVKCRSSVIFEKLRVIDNKVQRNWCVRMRQGKTRCLRTPRFFPDLCLKIASVIFQYAHWWTVWGGEPRFVDQNEPFQQFWSLIFVIVTVLLWTGLGLGGFIH